MQVLESYSEEDTFHFGETMGTEASPGTVITLRGNLGVGKTVFTKGFAVGLGITEIVNSPTFTILMCIGLGMFPKWTKSDSKITSMGTV